MGRQLTQRPTPGTLTACADALAAGQVTASDLVEQLLARRQAVDSEIRAFLSLDEAGVRAAAAAADARWRAGQPRGRFDGVPVAIKDNISVAGQPTGCAAKLLEGYTATYHATVVERLLAAGFIPMGRTNMDEFAMGSSTEHSAYAITRNPWDTDCVPGGSSGGSAAAVAGGLALAALGSDTGGSIRQPAAFCGVVGLKPTYGRVSRYGLVAFASSLDQIGPLTASVRDAAALLDVIGGHDPRDSTSLPAASGGFEAGLAGADVRGLRVGLPAEFLAVEGLAPEVQAAVERTLARLRAGGATAVPVSLPLLKYSIATYYVIATAEASSNLARFDGIRYGARRGDGGALLELYCRTRAAGFGPEVKRRIILGTYVLSSGYYDAYYRRAQQVRTLIRRDFAAAFRQCDVILGPVAPRPAFRVGEVTDPLTMYLSDIYTIAVNLAGNCALALPAGRSAAGLPLGVQLIGDALQEARLLQVGQWLEQTAGDAP